MAVYRGREIPRIELDSKEEGDFPRMNDLGARIQGIEPESFLLLENHEDDRFSYFSSHQMEQDLQFLIYDLLSLLMPAIVLAAITKS